MSMTQNSSKAERCGSTLGGELPTRRADHVIVLNERLKRLMAEYVGYYHEDRTHLGLAKDTPAGRPIEIRSPVGSKIRSFSRV
jgi:hypothetical protein